MILLASVGTYSVPEGTLRKAIENSNLPVTASKQQILRFSLLRLVVGATEARKTVFGDNDLTESKGRVFAKMPQHEVDMIQKHFDGASIPELARYGLLLSAGEPDREAITKALAVRPGRKPSKKDTPTQTTAINPEAA